MNIHTLSVGHNNNDDNKLKCLYLKKAFLLIFFMSKKSYWMD